MILFRYWVLFMLNCVQLTGAVSSIKSPKSHIIDMAFLVPIHQFLHFSQILYCNVV